ncbi:hypothetical protein Tco_0226341 [Tanacetum coccineum]
MTKTAPTSGATKGSAGTIRTSAGTTGITRILLGIVPNRIPRGTPSTRVLGDHMSIYRLGAYVPWGNQVYALETTCSSLCDEVMGYKLFKKQVEAMQDEQVKALGDRVATIDSDIMEMALHMDEEFCPRYLTTIAGQRWILSRGLKLAIMKCMQSPEYLATLGGVIGCAIDKGMQDGLAAGIDHGKAGLGLIDVSAYNLFAKAGYVTAINALQDYRDAKARRLSFTDAMVPLIEPLSAKSLIGKASASGILVMAMATALSTTFIQTNIVPSIPSTKVRILELKRRYFEDYYSENQYTVSIKEDTAYSCLHSLKTTKETSPIRRIQERQYTVFKLYGNKIFWKISNVVLTLRNLNTPYLIPCIRAKMKVVKNESQTLWILQNEDGLFTYETPLGMTFTEFNRLSGMDDDLFTYELRIPGLSYLPHGKQQCDDPEYCNDLDIYKPRICYDENKGIYAEAKQFNEYIEIKKQWMTHGINADMEYDPSDVDFVEWIASKFSNHSTMDID